MEKIINTLGAPDQSDAMMEDSWSIPTINHMSDSQTLDDSSNPSNPSNHPPSSLSNFPPASFAPGSMSSSSPAPPSNNDDGDTNPLEFLDDAQLETLDDTQLDSILDSLLIRIVEQMVEMTAADSELQEELNAPDKSGFTLLHYASMYAAPTCPLPFPP